METKLDTVTVKTEEVEDRVGAIEVKMMENNRAENKIGKGNSQIMREDLEGLFEKIIPENFLNVGKETGIKVQEAQRTPCTINKNNLTPRYIIVKLAKYKDKEKILKAARDKQSLTCKDRHIRLVADLPTETWQARREWQEIFNVMNRKNMQPRILYPISLLFRIEE